MKLKNFILEMAKPVKLCDKCGKQTSGYHYWYKGGWKCKSSTTQGTQEEKRGEKKESPAKEGKKRRMPRLDVDPPIEQWKYVFRNDPKMLQHFKKEEEKIKRREQKEKGSE